MMFRNLLSGIRPMPHRQCILHPQLWVLRHHELERCILQGQAMLGPAPLPLPLPLLLSFSVCMLLPLPLRLPPLLLQTIINNRFACRPPPQVLCLLWRAPPYQFWPLQFWPLLCRAPPYQFYLRAVVPLPSPLLQRTLINTYVCCMLYQKCIKCIGSKRWKKKRKRKT